MVLDFPSYFQLESVATAVIEIASPTPAFENLRLVAEWGTGSGSQPVQVPFEFFDVALVAGAAPADPNQWGGLPPSVYLSIPVPPGSSSAVSFSLPSDGTPPPYQSLLKVVTATLGSDPGGTLPDLASLSLAQCRNLAYEIVWSQQDPLPSPPDPIEQLYTNPPNSGVLLSGSTPNEFEGDRQQFEAKLLSYYALANSAADRLTSYVFSLAAAVACEEKSLAVTEALLTLPVNPGQPSTTSVNQTQVVLTGLDGVQSPTNFGVPAGYFYALTATMPPAITADHRYQLAIGDKLDRVLTELTSAINAGTVSDAETFTTLSPSPPAVSAAQAARRIASLNVPGGSNTAYGPLGTVALQTSADTSAGDVLPFTSTGPVVAGMAVAGPSVPAGTTVSGVSAGSVTLSQAITAEIFGGATVVFTPSYPADLQQLIQAWLAFPAPAAGPPSSQTYAPADDATQFWPKESALHPSGFLNLILCALTQGYIIPAPFNAALGDKISQLLASDFGALLAVTAAQWKTFFTTQPTWLPTFTQPGNLDARITAWIHHVQRFFSVPPAGPVSVVNAATSTDTPSGSTLSFASTSGITAGMGVSGLNIQPGTTVVSVTAAERRHQLAGLE